MLVNSQVVAPLTLVRLSGCHHHKLPLKERESARKVEDVCVAFSFLWQFFLLLLFLLATG
jgi:hypothetical protein